MDPSRLLRTPILVERVTQTGPPDEMGDPTEESTWLRFLGYVWQASSTETGSNGVIVTDQYQIALVRSANGLIHAGDRIVASGELDDLGVPVPDVGETYEVDGEPWPARNPRTQLIEYVQGRLVRTTV